MFSVPKSDRWLTMSSTFFHSILYTFISVLWFTKGQQYGDGEFGRRVSLYQYTYAAGIVYHVRNKPPQLMCGAAIIHPLWVLTAARCFPQDARIEDYEVFAGDVEYFSKSSSEQHRRIWNIVFHSNYTTFPAEFNIALVELIQPFDITNSVRSGFLPQGPLREYMNCKTLGLKNEWWIPTPVLVDVDTIARRREECLHLIQSPQWLLAAPVFDYCLISSSISSRALRDPFHGNIGAPSVCNNTIQAITSDLPFLDLSGPIIVTDVGKHLAWIRSNIIKREPAQQYSYNAQIMRSPLGVIVLVLQMLLLAT
ncbi:kallikrein-6-like [Photinus pyralis]|uniref:kallikrein-6-like n=1 Tax=Photinus pyralis TaxID=7054 RepID=UPI00126716D5|nr:kallikrein-6-like [Photinus pyralis]